MSHYTVKITFRRNCLLRRLCFYTCVSVHGGSTWASTPRAGTPRVGTPPGQVHPWAGTPILLECILVHRAFLQFYTDGKKIEFRDANNLRMTLLLYKPKVRPGCLSVAPPSLLFYEEFGKPGNWGPRDSTGEVRTLDCCTNPPKPGSFNTS